MAGSELTAMGIESSLRCCCGWKYRAFFPYGSDITPKLRAGDWAATKASARQFSRKLTQRQREIVQLLAEGLTIKQIAGLLNLSEKTVEFHKHHVMAAFNLRSNAAMVIFALKQGLISLKP